MRLLTLSNLAGLLAAALVLTVLSADAHATLPGRNGLISFQNYKDGDAVLGVRPDGTGRKRMFELPGSELATGGWKATGKRVLLEAGRKIIIANADGSNRSEVRLPDLPAPDSEDYNPGLPWTSPSWAPDSSRFAVQYNPNDNASDQQIYAISFKGAKPKRLAFGEKPAWDPKNRWVAFLARSGKCQSIRAVKPNGTGLRTLYAPGANCKLTPTGFDLAPDGRRLAFVATDGGRSDLYVATIGEGKARRVKGTGGAYQLAWSPDGRFVAFTDGDDGIRIVELSSGKVRLVAGRYSRSPSWQPR